MSSGYGYTAAYGELQYKGEVYPGDDYFQLAKGLLIEQYKNDYINSGTAVVTIVSSQPELPTDYPSLAENLLIEQYKKDYING